MFTAIHKTTNKRVISWMVGKDSSYQNIEREVWYADPNNIESYDETLVDDITKIKVIYIKQAKKNTVSGKKFFVLPHFRILNKSKLGINIIPESKEHKLAKNWIYNQFIAKENIELVYSEIKKPYKYQNKILISDLPIDYSRIGIEVRITQYNYKIVDVLIPFEQKHLLLGDGLAIEIQFSKQSQRIEVNRTIERALQGFSVAWLHEKDFDIEEEFIELKNNQIRVDSWASIIYNEIRKKSVQKLKMTVETQSRLIDSKIESGIDLIDSKLFEAKKHLDEKSNDLLNGNYDLDNKIKTEVSTLFFEHLEDIKKSLRPVVIDCRKCNSIMGYRKGVNNNSGKEWQHYKCSDCELVVWIND